MVQNEIKLAMGSYVPSDFDEFPQDKCKKVTSVLCTS
jgi:hypothetical protein